MNAIDIDGKLRRIYPVLDYWSDPQEEVQVTDGQLTIDFTPSVIIADIPPGATVVRAIAMIKFRTVENTAQIANGLDGATIAATSQVIRVRIAAGVWTDAINFADDQFSLTLSTREGGDVCMGSIDISGAGYVDRNATYNFRWLLSLAHADFLLFNDVQVGLRIWYSI